MKDSKADYTADEFEVIQMLGINARVRIDLKRVVVMG